MLRIPSNAGDSSAYKLKKSVETLLLALAKRYFSTKYSIFLNAECFFFSFEILLLFVETILCPPGGHTLMGQG